MRTPVMAPSLPGTSSLITGEGWFYGSYRPLLECNHSPFCIVWGYNENKPAGCGLCHINAIFETEFPKRLHEYELLAENGNPETSPAFWSRIESAMGLVPPKEGQDLNNYRALRARSYREPSRTRFPVTSSLWKMMGYQPKLAKPLLMSLVGMAPDEIGRQFQLSTYRVHETLGKGVRLALRYLRN